MVGRGGCKDLKVKGYSHEKINKTINVSQVSIPPGMLGELKAQRDANTNMS